MDSASQPVSAASRRRRLIAASLGVAATCLIYWVSASAVLDSFSSHWAFGDKWRQSRFHRAVNYTVRPPFVYRVLTPWMVNSISDALPEAVRARLAARTADLRKRYGLRDENDVEYAVAYYLMLLAYLGTLVVWRANLKFLGHGGPVFWTFAPPLGLLLLPMTFMQGGFIYDPAELFLTSLALHFLLRRRWPWFWLVFAVAVLNKDANILLPVWLLAVLAVERDWRAFLRRSAVAVAVGSPIILSVRWFFRDRTQSAFQPMWKENLTYLMDPRSYWSGFDVYATHVPAPEGFHLLNLVFLGLLLAAVWRVEPLREVRLIFLCTVLVYLPFFLLYGYRDEIRVFGPSFAAFFLLAANGIREAVAAAAKHEGEG